MDERLTDTKGQMLYESTYMIYLEKANYSIIETEGRDYQRLGGKEEVGSID